MKSENYPISEWPEAERPREKLFHTGGEHLSDAELLAIILRTGNKKQNAVELARLLLKKFGGLTGIEKAGIGELVQVEGIGLAKAAQIKACFELGRRLMQFIDRKKVKIRNHKDAVKYVRSVLGPKLKGRTSEYMYVLLLDSANRVLKLQLISKGDCNTVFATPAQILRSVLREGAVSFILIHNHPADSAQPSAEDIRFTKLLRNAAQAVGINFLDHIIICRNEHYSFYEKHKILANK